MEFSESADLTDQSGAITKRGTCTFEGETTNCVQKIYTADNYSKIAETLTRFSAEVQELGPKIIHLDDDRRAVYMEYIDCDTVKSYVEKIDIFVETDQAKFTKLLSAIAAFIVRMEDMGLCHDDLHQSNLMVCVSDTDETRIRMIDLDTLRSTTTDAGADACDDYQTIGESIFFCLVNRYRTLSDYGAKSDGVRAIVANMDVDANLKQYLSGR